MAALQMAGVGLLRSLKIMSRNKAGFFGFILVVLIVLTAYIAPLFVPLDKSAHVDRISQGPSAEHVLGTDYQGRDNLSQILNGGREIIYVAALAAALSAVIAVTLGALAALLGGLFSNLAVSLAEMVLTIPHFPLLIVVAGFLRLTRPTSLALILAAISWAGLMLAIRSQVLSLKEREYVQAARCLGLPTRHLLFREILPNMMSYVVISFVLAMTSAMYAQVGLIFLGIIPLSSHNWGVMISLAWTQGVIYSPESSWYLLAPVAVVALLQFSLVSMTRSLDELFNPRLRTGE
ncbi:MAG TPA: ABC transporter permease [Symbiobacteriaceae bacterium]|nr:ABC transporter permease [Symbiobacteriaceae bacterium]